MLGGICCSGVVQKGFMRYLLVMASILIALDLFEATWIYR